MRFKFIPFLIFFFITGLSVLAQNGIISINSLSEKYFIKFYILEHQSNINYIPLEIDKNQLTEYKGGKLPDKQKGIKTIFVFRSFFKIDKSLNNKELSLHIGTLNYPCRIFLNGNYIYSLGNFSDSYISRVRFSSSILLPPNFIKYNEINELSIQIYPHFEESFSLGKLFIASKKITDTYTFVRNYISLNLVQASLILAFILTFYFTFLFVLNRNKHDKKYLYFAAFCLFFGAGYSNISFSYNFVNEFLIYKISRTSLPLAGIFLLYYTIVATKIIKRTKILFTLLAIPTLIFVIIFITRTNLGQLEKTLSIFASTINLPYTLFAFILAIISLIKNKKKRDIWFVAGFIVLFATIIADTINYKSFTTPYSWVLPHGFFFFIITVFFILSVEQTLAFNLSIERGIELQEMKDNLEILVKERTQQIVIQNEELKTQAENLRELHLIAIERNVEIMQQKEEMQVQAENLREANVEITRQRDLIQTSHGKITDSLNYARRIQNAILPNEKLLHECFSDYFVFFKPKEIVSGDFYFVKKVNDFILFAVGDCTGHGVPGAFMSLLGIAFLNEIILRREITQSSEVLNVLRNQLKHSLNQTGENREQQDGLDIAFCAFNTKSKTLNFAGAHNSCYIVRNQTELIEIHGDLQPVGIFAKEKPFNNHYIETLPSDTIYLLSDGYYSQFGGSKNSKFKLSQFKEQLVQFSGKSLQQQKQLFENEFYDWKGNNQQTDDVLLLGFKM